jgi:hypothetical protein
VRQVGYLPELYEGARSEKYYVKYQRNVFNKYESFHLQINAKFILKLYKMPSPSSKDNKIVLQYKGYVNAVWGNFGLAL